MAPKLDIQKTLKSGDLQGKAIALMAAALQWMITLTTPLDARKAPDSLNLDF